MARVVKVEFLVESDGAIRGVRDVRGEFNRLDRDLDKSGKRAKNVGQIFNFSLGTLLADGIRIAITSIDDLVSKTFEMGAGAEETRDKFAVVFKEMAEDVDDFGKTFANRAGLTQNEFRDMISEIGILTKGFGADLQTAAEFSTDIISTAADFASFFNTSIDESFTALRSGIAGETEPLRRFIGFISEAEVKTRALKDTNKDQESQLKQLDLAQARYNIILERGADAIGNLDQTENSRQNTLRRINAVVREQIQLFSESLLPTFGLVLDVIDKLIGGSGELADTIIRFLAEAIFETVVGTIELVSAFVNLGQTVSMITEMFGSASVEGMGFTEVLQQAAQEVEFAQQVLVDGATAFLRFSLAVEKGRLAIQEFIGADTEAQSTRVRIEALKQDLDAIQRNIKAQEEEKKKRQELIQTRRQELQELLNNLGEFSNQYQSKQKELGDLLEDLSKKEKDKQAKLAREAGFLRRELEIEAMGDSLEARLAMIDLEFDKEKSKLQEKFGAQGDEMIALLEEQRDKVKKSEVIEDLRNLLSSQMSEKDFTPENFLPEDNSLDEFIENTLPLLDGSIQAIDAHLQDLGESWSKVISDEERDNIQSQIDELEKMKEGILANADAMRTFEDATLTARIGLMEATVQMASSLGAFLADTKNNIFNLGIAFRSVVSQIAGQLAKLFLAKAVGFAVAGMYGKAARLTAAAAIFAGLSSFAGTSAGNLTSRIQERRDQAPTGSIRALDEQLQDLRTRFNNASSQEERDRLRGQIARLEARRDRLDEGRAQGGRVFRGGIHPVGERGPELFVPSTSGQVISNTALRGVLSSMDRGESRTQVDVGMRVRVEDVDLFRLNVELDDARGIANQVGNVSGG